MWYLLVHGLATMFFVTAMAKCIYFTKDVLWQFWQGQVPNLLDFSCVKFLLYAWVCTKLNLANPYAHLAIVLGYVFYVLWLSVYIRGYRKIGHSWPRTAWLIIGHVGGPIIAWPQEQ